MVGEDPEEEVKAVDLERSFAHKSLLKRTAMLPPDPDLIFYSRYFY